MPDIGIGEILVAFDLYAADLDLHHIQPDHALIEFLLGQVDSDQLITARVIRVFQCFQRTHYIGKIAMPAGERRDHTVY
jgi:hypothetical protein